jgi:large subunit ribosomal protein L29
MAIMRLKEIKAMSSEDRAKKLVELRTELARMRTMIKAGGAVENPTRVRELRKTIAQVLTIENEVKLGIGQPAQEEEKPKKKAEAPAKEAKKPKKEEEKETAK